MSDTCLTCLTHVEHASIRRMLVEARWPNAKASAVPSVPDAPAWASIFDTHSTWASIIDGNHGLSPDGIHGEGWVKDASGLNRSMKVEVEQDQVAATAASISFKVCRVRK